ncbi:carcinoembryonic antigen-related cell adhesion molecule 1-like [Sparus aurata]|uniref:carcinoembryonic antigen-related cell adhesion molecule 1-like n=1 Tax=Sparus aurata TaxID=8175 RepID=UPI0011C138DF|nr:carcinoembryonic antigen-related cell adhesion molecule 1-like [Sparus aurata]
MEIAAIQLIVVGVISGLTQGAGVLPDGPLNAALGGTVMFTTTLTPPEKPFTFVEWKFGAQTIINTNTNATAEYAGRVTLFTSTGSLELRNLILSDSGEYRALIIPQGGSILEGTTRLEVYERISGTVVTSSTNLPIEGNSVNLTCDAAAGSIFTRLWKKDDSDLILTDNMALYEENRVLSFKSLNKTDSGKYSCEISNPVSNDKAQYIMIVNYGPENVNLNVKVSKGYYLEGSNISLSCSAVSRPAAQFYWLLNGAYLNDTGPEFKLVNIQMSQSGNYSCQAFNNKTLRYETSQSSAVTVLERISGTAVTPSTNLPIEGNSVNLTCDAAAGSIFTSLWKKDDSDLILTDNMALYEENRVLSFKSLNKTDSGKYSCEISNPVSNDKAQYIMIVKYGPENVQIKGPSKIDFGKTLTLTCSAESEPSATYTWTLNGTEIYSSSVFTKVITELSDSGSYTCQAMNNIAERTSSAVHQVTVTGTKMVHLHF